MPSNRSVIFQMEEPSESLAPPWCPAITQQATASPYDYVKAGLAAADRAASLGLTPTRLNDSFGGNQSFPRCSLTSQQVARRLESPCLVSRRIVSPYYAGTARSTDCLANCSLLAQGGRGSRLMQNPNKGWAIVSQTGQILVNNSILAALLGYSDSELRQVVLWDLLVRRTGDKRQESLDQLDLDPRSGDSLAYSGRVVSLTCKDSSTCSVSLNITKLTESSRFMVYIEPVHKTSGYIDVDKEGTIMDVDVNIETIFQTRAVSVVGEPVTKLIPSIQWPDQTEGSYKRFSSTGRLEEDICFPLSCIVSRQGEGCRLAIWVLTSLSGLILLDKEGSITKCDETFASLVLGYSLSQLVGSKIEKIIPGFYDEFEVPSCDKTEDDLGCEEISQSCENLDRLEESSPLEEISLNVRSMSFSKPSPGSPVVFKQPQPQCEAAKEKENGEESPVFKRPNSLSVRTPVKIPLEQLTSTPANSGSKCRPRPEVSLDRSRPRLTSGEMSPMPSGCFYGLARHSTGDELSVLYQVKRIVLQSGDIVYCVWVTRDSEEVGKTQAQLTLGSTLETGSEDTVDTPHQRSEVKQDLVEEEVSLEGGLGNDNEASVGTLTSGRYSDHYTTLTQIGKGAFGCVYSAYKNSDKLLVVTKFIRKSKVSLDMWVDGPDGERIPFEVSMLLALSHPGIVRVMEVFQNRFYVQMIMEKHGEMDLFEFIDRNPIMDESLASVIFRQIVAAVDFLHSREILHRDIKDENIIIDQKFSCKLIDFGSATFYKPGQLFNTFYGTMEYCSPEVLKGFPYEGPELEMWSLGVLLYIIMFGENPFFNAEDTMRAQLHPPHNDASQSCWDLIQSSLEPDPKKRASLWYIKEHSWVMMEASAEKYRFEEVIPCNNSEIAPATHYQVNENSI